MSSAPATEFPRFLELPFEIRWEIYELCLPKRVVEADIHDLPVVRKHPMTREEHLAHKYLVAKFSRSPVIARASPEVYRAIQRHVVAPTHGEWAWNRDDWGAANFTDPRPVYFDPKSDVLCYSPEDCDFFDGLDEGLEKSPISLAEDRSITLALDREAIECFKFSKSLADHCLLGRKNCIIILEEMTVVEDVEWITSCGLFGLFGEERTVLVDVDDLERVDYFDRKLNGQLIIPDGRNVKRITIGNEGLRRYTLHSTVDFQEAWCEDSLVVSPEERAEVIEKDKKRILNHLTQLWLEINGCFEDTGVNSSSFVPSKGEFLERVFDEEHPNAKHWYDKLPAMSFAVRVHVRDFEETSKLFDANEARRSHNRYQDMSTRSWEGTPPPGNWRY